MKTCIKVIACLVFVAIPLAVSSASAQGNKLVGVWKITEIKLPETPARNQDVLTIAKPQPSLIIFTEKHYSWIDASGEKSWPDLPQEAIDAQIAYLIRSFTANTGTYEIKGSTIIFNAIVAIDPKFMSSDMSRPMDFMISGDELIITWHPPGLIVPVEYKLSRLE